MSTKNSNTKSNTDSYAEHTVLTTLVGESPQAKILAVLLKTPHDINTSRIAELGGMSRSSVYRYIDSLINLGVVEKTREVGGSPLYQINEESPVAQRLAELEYELVDVVADETETGEEEFQIPDSPPC